MEYLYMDAVKKMPPAMILCGGKGTRLREVTELLPKPMVPIGEQPVLWHIMKSFSAFGVNRFILCLGYKKECFIDYFVNYHLHACDATIKLGHDPEITFHRELEEADWQVTLAGTGVETMTGGRVLAASKYLAPDDKEFFLTYGDGVADIDVDALLAHHRQGGRKLTVSAVHPEARFGEMVLDGNNVLGFEEKPAQAQGYINGGFMVVDRDFVTKYLAGQPDDFFERRPMQCAVKDSEMQVYRHNGFWQCMDNPREYTLLNNLWEKGNAPWTTFWK